MSAQNATLPEELNLRVGQSAFYTLDQGTMIVVDDGQICLISECYLAETIFPQKIQLANGQSYSIEATLHCQIRANTRAKIRLIPPVKKINKPWIFDLISILKLST
jgi:hypothetical protein